MAEIEISAQVLKEGPGSAEVRISVRNVDISERELSFEIFQEEIRWNPQEVYEEDYVKIGRMPFAYLTQKLGKIVFEHPIDFSEIPIIQGKGEVIVKRSKNKDNLKIHIFPKQRDLQIKIKITGLATEVKRWEAFPFDLTMFAVPIRLNCNIKSLKLQIGIPTLSTFICNAFEGKNGNYKCVGVRDDYIYKEGSTAGAITVKEEVKEKTQKGEIRPIFRFFDVHGAWYDFEWESPKSGRSYILWCLIRRGRERFLAYVPIWIMLFVIMPLFVASIIRNRSPYPDVFLVIMGIVGVFSSVVVPMITRMGFLVREFFGFIISSFLIGIIEIVSQWLGKLITLGLGIAVLLVYFILLYVMGIKAYRVEPAHHIYISKNFSKKPVSIFGRFLSRFLIFLK